MEIKFLWVYLWPILLFLTGVILSKSSPTKINSIFGYRTKRASLSNETWSYANLRLGKLSLIFGGILLYVSIFSEIIRYFNLQENDYINIHAYSGLLVWPICIFIIQRELRQKFDDNGKEKD
ncbi:SdpI family protein [Alkalibaculum sporogenes]|uniref:SdpI family protein n=1 Tax=Alkalibaculum sporogenes TaxID=2655001 RepID=UPI00128D3785